MKEINFEDKLSLGRFVSQVKQLLARKLTTQISGNFYVQYAIGLIGVQQAPSTLDPQPLLEYCAQQNLS